MLITIVAGARPNFMKIAPIIKAIQKVKPLIQYRLVHTGQHFDKKMSGDFFEQLGIPTPHINLECGGGSQAEQTAAIMIKFELELLQHKPDVVLVVGDVTSTMACAITAKKLCIDTVHVEAGIRSGDNTMPEEINRLVTDAIADYFFTTSEVASHNLFLQNIKPHQIFFVGNTMIDTLYQHLHQIQQPSFWNTYELKKGNYFLLTLHRPSNVDNLATLTNILQSIQTAAGNIPIIFPVHPRTAKMIQLLQLSTHNFIIIEPQPYLQFIYLIKHAKGIITDSGGITEEATVLHIPCITMRNSTERPETITQGTNELVGDDIEKLEHYINKILQGNWKKGSIPALWDGYTADRIIETLLSIYIKPS